MHDLVALDIASSGMAAQRIRMSVLASNLANAQSTRNVDGSGPYKRQMVVFESGTLPQFKEALAAEKATAQPGARSDYLVEQQMKDVAVSEIRSDPSVRRVYEPSHPRCRCSRLCHLSRHKRHGRNDGYAFRNAQLRGQSGCIEKHERYGLAPDRPAQGIEFKQSK